jgi:hypothetical protein
MWFPRLMTRAELEEICITREQTVENSIKSLDQSWNFFAYRLGITQGALSSILESEYSKEYLLTKNIDIQKLQKLLELMGEIGQTFYKMK